MEAMEQRTLEFERQAEIAAVCLILVWRRRVKASPS